MSNCSDTDQALGFAWPDQDPKFARNIRVKSGNFGH